MDARELWLRIMNHGEVDRIPVFHYGVWPETLRRWHSEGLPLHVGLSDFPGVSPKAAFIRGASGLFPPFCPLPDHNILPATSLADYRYYLEKLSEIRL